MDKGLKRIISNNIYMLKYIFKYAPGLVLGSLFQSVLSTASSIIATIYSVKYIIDSIQFERGYHSVFMALAAIVAVTVVNLLYNALFGSIYVRIALEKLNQKMQSQIFEKASKMDLACYEDPEFYNSFTWAMGEADKRAYGAFQTLNMVFKNLLMVMGVGALVLTMDKLSFVFIAVSVALNCAFSSRVNKLRFDMADELKPQQRKQGYISRIFYLPYYAKELRTTDIKPKLIKDYSGVVKDVKLIIDRYGKKLSLLNFICGFMCNTFIFDGLYLLYLSYKVIAEKVLSYGSFTALVRASSSIKDSINSIAMAGPQFYQHSLYIDKFRTFMEYRPGIKSPENPAGVPSMPVVLELKNVSFSYMGEERQALKNISLTIVNDPRHKARGFWSSSELSTYCLGQ